MKEKVLKGSLYGIVSIIAGILAFFIIFNAGWIIGDDAIVIKYTGWGHFFSPSSTVNPASGRFFPLAYIIYNILPIFHLSSVYAHFALLALIFILFCLVSFWAAHKAIDAKRQTWQDYVLALSASLVCVARAYCNFLDAYSTIWVDYTLVMIWALCCYYVHTRQSVVAVIVGLLSVSWLTYCLETNFVFPLAYGIIGLLFLWKNSTKLEKAYYWSLVGVAVIFLLLYFFICYLHIEEAYDGAHGQDITILGNAIKMFIAQKVLWIVFILVCWRAYRIIVKKEEFEFWDTMLLTGCAYCCGCAVMKLNWVLYYSLASLFMIPAIVRYLHKYLGGKWAWIVMLILALFTFRKVPGYIKRNQTDRHSSAEIIEILETHYTKGNTIYWYAPEDDQEWCFELDQRAWLNQCLITQLGWQIGEEQFSIANVKTFEGNNGIYVLPQENNKLFPAINENIMYAGEIIKNNDMCGFTLVEINNAL